MTKKKLAARILCAALALVMCLGLTVTASAQEGETPVTEAIITKILEMDKNVTTPTETFSFMAAKVSVDGKTDSADLETMPDIAAAGLAVNADSEYDIDEELGVKTVTVQTGNLLPDANLFPHAGVYVYRITETPGSNMDITYSNASYDLKIYVVNAEGGGLMIGGVEVYNEDDEKVTPPAPGPGETAKANMMFTNKYIPSGGNPDDPDAKALTVTNQVTGNLGDKTREFNYTLTITKLPVLVDQTKTYMGTITNADGTTETVELRLNEPAQFTLADGEYLEFDDLPVGTVYTFTMEFDPTYKMTMAVMSGSVAEPLITVDELGEATKSDVLIGEGVNSVKTIYHKESTVPGGVVLNNLPFILLILVALCGFTGYIAYNRNKRRS